MRGGWELAGAAVTERERENSDQIEMGSFL
jgi:hypothetical protein